MVLFIEQDGWEKAEEIDVVTEEEYYISKWRYLEPRIEIVKKEYEKLELKVKKQHIM